GSIAVVCFALDVALIVLGVAGMGSLVASHPVWLLLATLFGFVFLTLYGLRAWVSACGVHSLQPESHGFSSRRAAMTGALVLSLINPHVYIDTVLLLGSIGGQLPGNGPWLFALGACSASALWFFSLSMGAQFLAPLFASPRAWKILDAVVGAVMLSLAWSLLQMAEDQFNEMSNVEVRESVPSLFGPTLLPDAH
ncbi:MAG: LysE family transporter, partial [Pseudomonadales bacterium]|nr:LysE family transporter [Pseudomonadales bacterium]